MSLSIFPWRFGGNCYVRINGVRVRVILNPALLRMEVKESLCKLWHLNLFILFAVVWFVELLLEASLFNDMQVTCWCRRKRRRWTLYFIAGNLVSRNKFYFLFFFSVLVFLFWSAWLSIKKSIFKPCVIWPYIMVLFLFI